MLSALITAMANDTKSTFLTDFGEKVDILKTSLSWVGGRNVGGYATATSATVEWQPIERLGKEEQATRGKSSGKAQGDGGPGIRMPYDVLMIGSADMSLNEEDRIYRRADAKQYKVLAVDFHHGHVEIYAKYLER